MDDIQHLTVQNAALMLVLRALVETHPDRPTLLAAVQQRADLYLAASDITSASAEHRAAFKDLVARLVQEPAAPLSQG